MQEVVNRMPNKKTKAKITETIPQTLSDFSCRHNVHLVIPQMGEREVSLGYQQSKSKNFLHCARKAPGDCRPKGVSEKEQVTNIKKENQINLTYNREGTTFGQLSSYK